MSTDPLEDATTSLASQRAALQGLEWTDPLLQAAYTRVSRAWDELHSACYVAGIDLDSYVENKVTLGVLADAFAFKWWCRCREPIEGDGGVDYLDPERAS